MQLAIILQVVAGVCAALLTLGRPFMRLDSNRHKIWHTVIGVIGIGCIIGAGILSWSAQSGLSNSFAELQHAVRDLGNKVGTTGDSTKILAAAARTIDRLN